MQVSIIIIPFLTSINIFLFIVPALSHIYLNENNIKMMSWLFIPFLNRKSFVVHILFYSVHYIFLQETFEQFRLVRFHLGRCYCNGATYKQYILHLHSCNQKQWMQQRNTIYKYVHSIFLNIFNTPFVEFLLKSTGFDFIQLSVGNSLNNSIFHVFLLIRNKSSKTLIWWNNWVWFWNISFD